MRMLPLVVAAAALVLTACDTPLGASVDARGVRPGEPVTGVVEHPDGEITVTLADAGLPEPRPSTHTPGSVACAYDDGDATFSCPTDGLAPGAYRVEVTDAKFASEGTTIVPVAVSPVDGYAPSVTVDPADPRTVRLTGWVPGDRLDVRASSLDRDRSVRLVADVGADGTATVRLPDRLRGPWAVSASDGTVDTATYEELAVTSLPAATGD